MEKDTQWKTYFDDNRRYADLINGIGCDGMQLVKSTDLQEADPTAKKKSRDLLRKTAFGVNFAIIGIENQDKIDYGIPLRCMHYDVSRYQKQASAIAKEIRANPANLSSGEYMYGFKQDSKLHPLITFVLYSGSDEWNGNESLHDMLDFTDIPEKLKSMTPNYNINVIDIRKMENTDVFKTDVKHVFDFIRCAGNKAQLLELVNKTPYFSEMEDDAFDVVSRYTNSKELIHTKKYIRKDGKQNVCKAIRDLMEDSRQEGIEQGISILIETLRDMDQTDAYIMEKLMDKYSLTKTDAENWLLKVH